MNMSLYKKIKSYLPPHESVISDADFLLLNRRDYNVNQLSTTNALLELLAAKVGYPYRVLLAFLDAIASSKERDDFNIVLSDPSLVIAAYIVWVRSGGTRKKGKIYAPKGCPSLPAASGLVQELIESFNAALDTSAMEQLDEDRKVLFTFVLGNTKTAEQTSFAFSLFSKIQSGLLVMKDYARTDAFPERELTDSLGLFPTVTFEGHAFILRQ